MHIACVGGGPAGLRLAIALKRADSRHQVTVFERQPCAAQLGWGVTVSTELLDEIRLVEPALADQIAACSIAWTGQRLYVRGEHADREGDGAAVGRAQLVEALTQQRSRPRRRDRVR